MQTLPREPGLRVAWKHTSQQGQQGEQNLRLRPPNSDSIRSANHRPSREDLEAQRDKRKPKQAAPTGDLAWVRSRPCPVTTESLSDTVILSSELEGSTNQRLIKAPLSPGGDPWASDIKKVPNIFNYL